MPLQPVKWIKRRGILKRRQTVTDPLGGVFRPVPGAHQLPVYTAAASGGKTPPDALLLYQCPQSAIPEEVWAVLALWWNCRMTGTLPVAGTFLDQPAIVQRGFPVLESLQRQVERQQSSPETAAALAVGSLMQAMGGGGAKRR